MDALPFDDDADLDGQLPFGAAVPFVPGAMAEPVPEVDDEVVEPAPAPGPPKVEVRRSAKRRRTVSAYRDGDTTIVLIPARMSKAEEREMVAEMVERLERSERRRRPGDDDLMNRSLVLSKRYLGGRAKPMSVRWVTNQESRWGSCTPIDGTIRLSHRMKGMPQYVIDYVLVHELAHLLVDDHGPRFQALMEAYPTAERARGYLEGWIAAKHPS